MTNLTVEQVTDVLSKVTNIPSSDFTMTNRRDLAGVSIFTYDCSSEFDEYDVTVKGDDVITVANHNNSWTQQQIKEQLKLYKQLATDTLIAQNKNKYQGVKKSFDEASYLVDALGQQTEKIQSIGSDKVAEAHKNMLEAIEKYRQVSAEELKAFGIEIPEEAQDLPEKCDEEDDQCCGGGCSSC